MARLHGVDMPVIQFIQVSGEARATDVAYSFAQTSAACLGRTLLIRLGQPVSPEGRHIEVAPAMASIARRRTRKPVAESIEIVPDSTVSGLCHAYLGRELAESPLLRSSATQNWLDGVNLDFKLIIIESSSPERCPATLDLATRCHGSVLVVTAGVSSLWQSRTVMRQVRVAGGTFLGSILHDAPSVPRLSIKLFLKSLLRKSLD